MAVEDVTKFLFVGSDKPEDTHEVPRVLAKYLYSDDIGQFIFNKNYLNNRMTDLRARENDVHFQAHVALMNFISRMKKLELTNLDNGEANQLYTDIYAKWNDNLGEDNDWYRNFGQQAKDFFNVHLRILDTRGKTVPNNQLESRKLSDLRFKFNGTNIIIPGVDKPCTTILSKLPRFTAQIWTSSTMRVNAQILDHYCGEFNSPGGGFYANYAQQIGANLPAYFGKALSRSSSSSSSNQAWTPDPSICPSNQAKYWKFDYNAGDWYFEMDGKRLSLNEHADYDKVFDPSTCYNLFVEGKSCNEFARIITDRSSQSMESFLQSVLMGDEFDLFKNAPSAEDFKKMDPRAARKILKKFGFQKVRVTHDGYERVQTVQEWIDSRLYKTFSVDKVIDALQTPKNIHVLTFLTHCTCRADTLYTTGSLNKVLFDKFRTNNPLVEPYAGVRFDLNGGASLDSYKQFLESGRHNQLGGVRAHDSTGGLLSHFMKLNNVKYPNLSTTACKYLESNSANISSLWENAFKIIDKTSYNRGYLISNHIKNKVLEEIKAHKKLTAELTSVVCGLESLSNVENSGNFHEAAQRNNDFIQTGGQPDAKYQDFKRLAQRSYDNMLRVNHKLKDNDKRLRGLFLRIIEMMSKDELEDLED